MCVCIAGPYGGGQCCATCCVHASLCIEDNSRTKRPSVAASKVLGGRGSNLRPYLHLMMTMTMQRYRIFCRLAAPVAAVAVQWQIICSAAASSPVHSGSSIQRRRQEPPSPQVPTAALPAIAWKFPVGRSVRLERRQRRNTSQ